MRVQGEHSHQRHIRYYSNHKDSRENGKDRDVTEREMERGTERGERERKRESERERE